MKNKFQLIAHFLLSVLVTFLFASLFHSHFVIAELVAINIEVPFAARMDMTLSDLMGLLPGYGGIILVSLLLGYLLINALTRWVTPLPRWRYVIAGFIAIGAALLAMHPIFNVSLIAGARSPLGIIFQCLAGAMGGIVFMTLRNKAETNND